MPGSAWPHAHCACGMPRSADQRCLRFSIARAQAQADESALRLEGGSDVAHAAFFITIALADNGTTPADLGPKDRPLHLTRYAITPHRWTPAHRLTDSPPLSAGALGICTWPDSWLLHLALLPQAAALLDVMQPLQQLARVASYQARLAVRRRQKGQRGQAVVSRRLQRACRCPCTHHLC